MYMETIINGKLVQAMLDTGAKTVYMAKELANEVGLPYTKEKGYMKEVNVRASLSRALLGSLPNQPVER